jgi:hypothetical protein
MNTRPRPQERATNMTKLIRGAPLSTSPASPSFVDLRGYKALPLETFWKWVNGA